MRREEFGSAPRARVACSQVVAEPLRDRNPDLLLSTIRPVTSVHSPSPAADARQPAVLVVTTFFPNSADPHRAVFVKNLVKAMLPGMRLDVVAPVPWAPPARRWRAQRAIAAVEHVDGIAVAHPRFPVIPGLEALAGLGYALGILPTLWRMRRRPVRPVVHVHCAYPDAVGVALAARLAGLRHVVTAHGSDLNVYARKPLLRPQIAWALRRAAAVVAVSRPLAQAAGALPGVRAERVHQIACAAFDPAVFRPRDSAVARVALGLPPRPARVVLFVGQLVPVKGLPLLLEAWSALRARGVLRDGDRLVLIGEGPEQAVLQRRFEVARDPRVVQFAGPQPQAAVASWMAAATALCLPSHAEGTPNVVVEALACGLPVVATQVGGLADLVEQGTAGLLVPPGDAAALADALARAFERRWDVDAIRATVAARTWAAIGAANRELIGQVAAA